MGDPDGHHLIAFVTGPAGDHLEEERRRWDPVMAGRVAGHVTVVYPTEAPRVELLDARLAAACERTPPFPLVMGEVVAHEGNPRRGVHHLVHDPVGVWHWLREFLLAPPLAPLDVVAHATIAHPHTAESARQAWEALGGHDPALEFRVGSLHLLAVDDGGWRTVASYELGGGVPPPP